MCRPPPRRGTRRTPRQSRLPETRRPPESREALSRNDTAERARQKPHKKRKVRPNDGPFENLPLKNVRPKRAFCAMVSFAPVGNSPVAHGVRPTSAQMTFGGISRCRSSCGGPSVNTDILHPPPRDFNPLFQVISEVLWEYLTLSAYRAEIRCENAAPLPQNRHIRAICRLSALPDA